jgi:hypothetical protein
VPMRDGELDRGIGGRERFVLGKGRRSLRFRFAPLSSRAAAHADREPRRYGDQAAATSTSRSPAGDHVKRPRSSCRSSSSAPAQTQRELSRDPLIRRLGNKRPRTESSGATVVSPTKEVS